MLDYRSVVKYQTVKHKVADLSPKHLGKQSATNDTKLDVNIGVAPGFGVDSGPNLH